MTTFSIREENKWPGLTEVIAFQESVLFSDAIDAFITTWPPDKTRPHPVWIRVLGRDCSLEYVRAICKIGLELCDRVEQIAREKGIDPNA